MAVARASDTRQSAVEHTRSSYADDRIQTSQDNLLSLLLLLLVAMTTSVNPDARLTFAEFPPRQNSQLPFTDEETEPITFFTLQLAGQLKILDVILAYSTFGLKKK